MFKAVMNNGVMVESRSVKAIWYAISHDRRYDKSMGYGLTGGILYAPDGRKIYEWLDGDKIPLEDTEISVRAYHKIRKRAYMLGMNWKRLTTGDVARMAAKDIKLWDRMDVINEIVTMLIDTCGNFWWKN